MGELVALPALLLVGHVFLGVLDHASELGDVELADTIRGFKGLCEGKYDYLPEAAFYMVGTIEQAVEKGKKLAAEAA